MLINPENREIISLAFAKGTGHDFQLFKSSKIRLKPGVQLTADRGYQGFTKLHANSVCRKSLAKIVICRSKTANKYRSISRKRIAV